MLSYGIHVVVCVCYDLRFIVLEGFAELVTPHCTVVLCTPTESMGEELAPLCNNISECLNDDDQYGCVYSGEHFLTCCAYLKGYSYFSTIFNTKSIFIFLPLCTILAAIYH